MARKTTKPAPVTDELEAKGPEKIVELDDEEVAVPEDPDVAAESLEDALEEEFSPDMDEDEETEW